MTIDTPDAEGPSLASWTNEPAPEQAPEQAPESDSAGADVNARESTAGRCECGRRTRTILLGPLLILAALFVYSFAVQFNDASDMASWLAFYAAHVLFALVCIIVLSPCCCGSNISGQGRIVLLASAAVLGIWSVVMVILSAVDLSKTEAGGEERGGDNDGATEREEKAYEVAGAAVGLVSAMYAACLVKTAPSADDRQEEMVGKPKSSQDPSEVV